MNDAMAARYLYYRAANRTRAHRIRRRTIFGVLARFSGVCFVAATNILVLFFLSHRKPKSVPFPYRPYARNIIVSERSGLLYCPIPKAANTNWKYLIRKWEGYDDYANVHLAHSPHTSGLRYLSDYHPREAAKLLPRLYKFTFVRDPYSRLVSAYMDKLRNVDKDYVRSEYRTFLAAVVGWKRARDLNDDERPSFRTFIDSLAQTPRSEMNAHWRPQVDLCGIGEMNYDFVGRMESLAKDANVVFRALNRTHEKFPTHADIGFPPSGATRKLGDELFTLDLMLKVRVIYADDFEQLAY